MSISQIIADLKAHDTIIIHRHVRPDPDALGSQAGLKAIIQQTFADKQVYAVGEEEDSLKFLTVMDQIGDEVYKNALVIICDTANVARISDERYKLGKKLIKIDHHPDVDAYAELQWVSTEASSTSEMVYELYLQGKEEGLKMNDQAARLLYAGIVGDTGRFLFPSTTAKTLKYTADLVNYSFDRPELYDGLYRVNHRLARLKGYILQHFTLTESGLSVINLTKDILKEHQLKASETSQLVGVLGDIEGIKAWVFFVEEDDQIRVRLRSKGPVINGVAANYNGGGHPMASGATVYTWEEAEALTADLEKVCSGFDR